LSNIIDDTDCNDWLKNEMLKWRVSYNWCSERQRDEHDDKPFDDVTLTSMYPDLAATCPYSHGLDKYPPTRYKEDLSEQLTLTDTDGLQMIEQIVLRRDSNKPKRPCIIQ
jgi:hypothetical protein